MTRGNRTISAVPKGLVYHNLGTFFASRGITTLVPDYRRVDSKHGGEGAVRLFYSAFVDSLVENSADFNWDRLTPQAEKT